MDLYDKKEPFEPFMNQLNNRTKIRTKCPNKEIKMNGNNTQAKLELLVTTLRKYADRENWGYIDDSGCPKGYGHYTESCFIGPGAAEEALKAYDKANHVSKESTF